MRYFGRNVAVLDLGNERKDLKKRRYEEEGTMEYRKANKRVQKALKKAKEDWIDTQCTKADCCLKTVKKHISL